MSDLDEELDAFESEEAGDSEAGDSEGGKSGDGKSNPCSACCCLLIGLLLWPGALYAAGWNEQRVVCREKAILAAEKYAVDLQCDQHARTAAGKPIEKGALGYLSCDLDQSTFTNWTAKKFAGLEGMDQAGAAPLMGPKGVAALAMRMHVQMYVCEESCARERCGSRRLGEDTEEAGDPRAAEARQLRKKEKSCTKHCVEWRYSLRLTDRAVGVANFRDNEKARRQCGSSRNPTSPGSGLTMGSSDLYGASGQVKVKGGGWDVNNWQSRQIPIDDKVPLPRRSPPPGLGSHTQPPTRLGHATTYVEGDAVRTCANESVGCLVIGFTRAAPEDVTMLGLVSAAHPGRFSEPEEGLWPAPRDWLCGSGETVNRVCPMTSSIDLASGIQSCSGGLSKGEFFDDMKGENSTAAWIYRLVSFFCVWLAVFCVCSPITAIVEWATDSIDDLTDCIPGVGCVVDLMTDMIVGVVRTVVCMLAFACAVSSFLLVAGTVWAAMRPMVAVPALVLGLCCCCGTCFAARSCAQQGKKKDGGDEESGEDQD